ncbi:MAG: ATP-binding protein, partial [Candidatus Binatia bacterium]
MPEPVNILLVDDEPRNLDALEALLDLPDYRLVRAQSADEALLALLRGDFAVIVLDIRMPGVSGFELAQLIKQRKRTQHIPVLFLTAHLIEETDVLRGYGTGAVDYLSKPINPEILRSKIAVFADLFRKTRALADANQALEERVRERTAELTRANEALRQRERELRSLADNTPDLIARFDRSLRHVFVNAACERATGRSASAFLGKTVSEASRELTLGPDIFAEAEAAMRSVFDTGTPASFEFVLDGPEGVREFEAQLVPEFDAAGHVEFVLSVARDVTDRKEAERQRERLLERERAARTEAEHANRMKDEFLATVSHELRSPLNAIFGWAQLLLRGHLDEKRTRDALETIERNARAQARLIEDLLDMSRITAGKIRLELQRVNLRDIAAAAIAAHQPAADAKGIRLTAALDPESGAVNGDPTRLQQVVSNLLANAIKFTPAGGEVDIRLHPAQAYVALVVSDSGQGIKSEFLPHVFDKFRQADGSTTRKHGGLGLGLTIVRHVVELHGGSVQVDSA